ncbi:MAG: DUF481 domain-containing protein [Sandaracinaceae bacterium]|nr:DUF481 domain-containing protein [Sandaracinaceae bacterium]
MMRSTRLSLVVAMVCVSGTVAMAGQASAQVPAAPAQNTESVANPPPPDEPDDETVWSLSLGGTANTGNTRSLAISTGTNFRLRRGAHQLTIDGQWTYGRASIRTAGVFGPWQQNADNLNGRGRYDYFLTERDAVFGVAVARRDHFAGLDSRLQFQAGYARSFVQEENHRLWAEVGYDVTLDNFYPNPLLDPMTMQPLPGSDVFHSARIFAGYDNHVSERWSVLTGLEGLIDVQTIDNIRINWISELGLTIVDGLAAKLQYTMRFDNVPVSGTGKLDTTTILNLTYTLQTAAEAE